MILNLNCLGQSYDATSWDVSSRKGIARTQTPTNKNYTLELFTFETIIGVNLSVVQLAGFTLGEPPSWSWLTPTPGKYACWMQQSEYKERVKKKDSEKVWSLAN